MAVFWGTSLPLGILAVACAAVAQPLSFHRDPEAAPVLSSGTPGTPLFVIDSCAIRDEEGYHLFFSSFFVKKGDTLSLFRDADFSGEAYAMPNLVTAIAYAYSADQGRNWHVRETPILTPPPGKEWDSNRVETASAIIQDDTLYVFYCADGYRGEELFRTRYQIGVGTVELAGGSVRKSLLDDAKTLARPLTAPLLPCVTDKPSFRNNVQEPSVLWKDGRFELYFVGLGLTAPDQPIPSAGQGIASVGMGRAIVTPNLQVLEVSDEALLPGANIIEIKAIENGYYLFSTASVDGGHAHKGEDVEYYTSEDGLKWSSATPALRNLPAASFDSWGRMSPTVVREGDQWILFYTGLESAEYADRWGIPMDGKTRLYATLGRAVSSERAPAGPKEKEETERR